MRVGKTGDLVEDLLKRNRITINGKSTRAYRCLAEIYIGRKLRKNEVVHHKDRNSNNNSKENLEILPRGEHVKLHYFEDKRDISHLAKYQKNPPHPVGEKHCNTWLKNKDVLKMRKLYNVGKKRICEIAKLFNCDYNIVHNICANRNWKHLL